MSGGRKIGSVLGMRFRCKERYRTIRAWNDDENCGWDAGNRLRNGVCGSGGVRCGCTGEEWNIQDGLGCRIMKTYGAKEESFDESS
jgi:hypothetical protein